MANFTMIPTYSYLAEKILAAPDRFNEEVFIQNLPFPYTDMTLVHNKTSGTVVLKRDKKHGWSTSKVLMGVWFSSGRVVLCGDAPFVSGNRYGSYGLLSSCVVVVRKQGDVTSLYLRTSGGDYPMDQRPPSDITREFPPYTWTYSGARFIDIPPEGLPSVTSDLVSRAKHFFFIFLERFFKEGVDVSVSLDATQYASVIKAQTFAPVVAQGIDIKFYFRSDVFQSRDVRVVERAGDKIEVQVNFRVMFRLSRDIVLDTYGTNHNTSDVRRLWDDGIYRLFRKVSLEKNVTQLLLQSRCFARLRASGITFRTERYLKAGMFDWNPLEATQSTWVVSNVYVLVSRDRLLQILDSSNF